MRAGPISGEIPGKHEGRRGLVPDKLTVPDSASSLRGYLPNADFLVYVGLSPARRAALRHSDVLAVTSRMGPAGHMTGGLPSQATISADRGWRVALGEAFSAFAFDHARFHLSVGLPTRAAFARHASTLAAGRAGCRRA